MSKKLKEIGDTLSVAEIEKHGLTLQEYYWLKNNRDLATSGSSISAYGKVEQPMAALITKGYLTDSCPQPSAAKIKALRAKASKMLDKAKKMVMAGTTTDHYHSPGYTGLSNANKLLEQTRPNNRHVLTFTTKALRFLHESKLRKEAAPMNINANVKLVK